MYDGKIIRAGQDGSAELILSRETIFGGLGWLPDGTLLVVDKPKRQILTVSGEKVAVHADLSTLGTSPLNEMLVQPDGSLLVGEYGFDAHAGEPFRKGHVFHVTRAGAATPVEGAFSFPNGMVTGPDRTTVFVAESLGRRITQLTPTGGTYAVSGPLTKFAGGFPDGLCLDGTGRIWAALVGTKSIVAINSGDGSEVDRITFDKQPFDVCYAPDPDRLFVALSDADEGDLTKQPLPRTGEITVVTIHDRM